MHIQICMTPTNIMTFQLGKHYTDAEMPIWTHLISCMNISRWKLSWRDLCRQCYPELMPGCMCSEVWLIAVYANTWRHISGLSTLPLAGYTVLVAVTCVGSLQYWSVSWDISQGIAHQNPLIPSYTLVYGCFWRYYIILFWCKICNTAELNKVLHFAFIPAFSLWHTKSTLNIA